MKRATGGGLPARIFKAYMIKAEAGPSDHAADRRGHGAAGGNRRRPSSGGCAGRSDSRGGRRSCRPSRRPFCDLCGSRRSTAGIAPLAREEIVSGAQEQLVPGGRQIVQGEEAGRSEPSERSDAELIDAFESLLDKLF